MRMWMTIAKIVGTAIVVAALSEITKRSTFIAAIIVALPSMTVLTVAFTAMNKEGGIANANAFANSTFLLVPPGLAFFIVLWGAQRLGAAFWPSFALAVVATLLATWGFTLLYRSLGVKL